MRKTTEELTNEIINGAGIQEFCRTNEENFAELSLSAFLKEMLYVHNASKREVFERADMTSTNYGYEMFHSDAKAASRDKIIQISMGFPLTLEETQQALRFGGVSALYPRVKRDALIMMAIQRGYDVSQLNELLYENQEKTLF